jgi:site-specific recombinase XerD
LTFTNDVTGFVPSSHCLAVKGKTFFEDDVLIRGRSFSMSGDSTQSWALPPLSAAVPGFLAYARAELQFAEQSLIKYQDCLRQVQRLIGDRSLDAYSKDDVLLLKTMMLSRGHSVSRQVSILSAFKSLLEYCRHHHNWLVLAPDTISVPKRPRREVVYLTSDEVSRFLAVIPLASASRTRRASSRRQRAAGLRSKLL